MVLVQKEVKKVYLWNTKVRPENKELCFTANTAGSSIQLHKSNSPTDVTLETSTNWSNWTTYTFNDTITLSNIWDKVYWRNTSETTTGFTTGTNNYYYFIMTWSIAASGNVTSLVNKNCTDTLNWTYCFRNLFYQCSSLTSAPSLPATTLTSGCYYYMFRECTNLETLPELPATTLTNYCYYNMFRDCSKIKLSTTQTWEYQTAYRIPTTWTWTALSDALTYMFDYTWWTFTWTPSINTTYYTSNTLV